MRSCTLELPVLVGWWKDRGYRVRPLFMDHPESMHKSFEKAMERFIGKLRNKLRHFRASRERCEELLWYKFNPEVRYHRFELSFDAGGSFVSGTFGAASFELKGYPFVCLPHQENLFFIARQDSRGRIDFLDGARAAVRDFWRRKEKELGKDFLPELYMSPKKDFVTTVEVSVPVQDESFPLGREPEEELFSLLAGLEDFEGRTEIEKVGRDLNEDYPYGLMRACRREEEAKRLERAIYGEEKVPTVVVGPAGAGKTTLIHEAIRGHLTKHGHKRPFDIEKVWHLDPNRVIAGMSVVGMWEKRFEAILEYVRKRLAQRGASRTDALWVDNPVALLRAGRTAQTELTLSDVLKPYLESKAFLLLCEATPEEWKVIQEMDRGFADLFRVIRVDAPGIEAAAEIVMTRRALLEKDHRCEISNEAVQRVFSLQQSFLRDKALPGSVADLLERLAVKYAGEGVGVEEVLEIFGNMSGLNHKIFDKSEKLSDEELRGRLGHWLVGQQEALECLADTVHLLKSGLRDPRKPVATLLFVGPTGVGKTQAAKALARYLFDSPEGLVRFDMNEYVDPGAAARLVGDFHRPQGQLTAKVRHRPFCVLLLDEIEKAHPSVHDLLLQLLGEGRLTDAAGRTTDFTNVIVLMSSNAGAREAGKLMGFRQTPEGVAEVYEKSLRSLFRPELLNRIDRTVVFKRLDLEDVKKIARLHLEELCARDGFSQRTIVTNVDEKTLEDMAASGFDEEMGGRALKRVMERELAVLAARQMALVPSHVPLLLEIARYRGKPFPLAIPLEETAERVRVRLPGLDESDRVRRAFEELIERAREMRLDLEKLSEREDVRKEELYHLRDGILEVQDVVEEVFWGMSLARDDTGSITLRGSRMEKDNPDVWVDANAVRAAWDMQEYLKEAYRDAPLVVEASKARYVSLVLRLGVYRLFLDSWSRQGPARTCIHIQSLAQNRGGRQTSYLLDRYATALDSLLVDAEEPSDLPGLRAAPGRGSSAQERFLISSMPGLKELLAGEEGVHLFHVPYEAPVPVRVRTTLVPSSVPVSDFLEEKVREKETILEDMENGDRPPDASALHPGPVVRHYSLPSGDSGQGIWRDSRTGWVNRTDMPVEDWIMLICSGLDRQEEGLFQKSKSETESLA